MHLYKCFHMVYKTSNVKPYDKFGVFTCICVFILNAHIGNTLKIQYEYKNINKSKLCEPYEIVRHFEKGQTKC